ncbi:hypothetical protein [Brevundimonas variabilis]|uniref:MYXO-CTERM domain-containing protein n=1 Tax=Brevundimonas variabilis TaxID=74312 RepID=A0A7W9CL70_9CAUL|nr:hypothetical protein [Brevundimonas variabilis]MBB5747682.1 MYXO-CTERM domain-containing protein [Brevundimonas variabilis]
MIGDGFDPRPWTLVLIGLGVLLGIVRLLLWQRSAPVAERSPPVRLALLGGLQMASGLLLFLCLFPPSDTVRAGALFVATEATQQPSDLQPGDILVALPEAGAIEGAVRVPDLATALRQFPDASGIRILGQGLPPRDQGIAPKDLVYDPPAAPRGLIEVALPDRVAAGASFSVGGQIGSLPRGSIELVDPAGTVASRRPVAAGTRFIVTGTARTPELALFTLRLRDASGGTVEQMTVPVQTRNEAPPRVRVLAGAPGPETKFLRRWAGEAGIDLGLDIDVGAGVQLGDGRTAITRAALADIDLLVIDDRRWEGLGASERSILTDAVSEGLGLLLRPTGTLSPTSRREWAAMGAPLTGAGDSVATRLDPPSAVGEQAGRSDTRTRDPVVELTRRELADPGSDAVSLLRSADGVALASWRSRGRGRIGVWTITDSYALVLTGDDARYADLWSDLFSTLARASGDNPAKIEGLVLTGRRTQVCRIEGTATILAPDGTQGALLTDPQSGDQACGAYWPALDGWHVVRDGQGRETPFYAQSRTSAPSLAIWADRQATLALTGAVGPARGTSRTGSPGSSWPWFAGLLVIAALLWWLERRRPAKA